MLETNSKYEYYSIQDWENAAEYEIDPATIGQYTGLKDRNGTEIYEGDIAEWKDTDGNRRVDVVRYTYGGFHLCNTCYPVGHYTVHIIGNVHDNPELLGSEVE
jgi:uncharacterized phage protein (TIGR01671 family)